MAGRVGHQFGKYEILAELGQDEWGTIYKAKDPALEKVVTIRVLPRLLTFRDPSLSRRLIEEAKKLSHLVHPHIARTLAAEEIEGYLCIISDHVSDHTLRNLLQSEGNLTLERAQQIMGDIAAAIDEAHQQGIPHGGIRPTNIFLTAEGQAVLGDFGLARILHSLFAHARDHQFGVAPAYMAPEIARGEKPSAGADIYALGIILYEMLTGHPPFRGQDTAIILAHISQEPPPPSQANRRLPQAVDEVVRKALAKDPAARYSSASQLVEALSDASCRRAFKLPFLPGYAYLAIAALILILAGGWAWYQFASTARRTNTTSSVQLARGTNIGAYEVTAPKRIRIGETATIHLALHIPPDLSPENLPSAPATITPPQPETVLLGSVSLCRYIWARLESRRLDVIGPTTIQRIIQPPGVDWLWNICCQPGEREPGRETVAIQMFVRQISPDGTPQDVLLKDIRFDIEITPNALSVLAVAPWTGAGAVLVIVAIMLVLRLRREKAR